MTRRTGSHRVRRTVGDIGQLPWLEVSNPYAPTEVLNAEQVETIHQASLQLLKRVGMRVLNDEARAIFAKAGASVDVETLMVRLDPEMVMETISTTPSEFVLRARNPAHDLSLGANRMAFAGVGGPAFVSDLEKGRRPGTYAEQCDYIRLIQSLNIIHQEGGGPFEAMDLPPETRHLDLHLAQIRLMDKNWQGVALGRERTLDGINMACIALGVDREELARRPAILCIINTNSPLQLDIPMAEGTMALARAGQVACITPFTLAGSMSPVTLAGTLVQQNAEVLFGVVLTQLVRPGAPAMYGAFTSNVDLKSGAPALGTPEYTKAAVASGQLARYYKLPFRSSNTNASNAVDAQAAYESEMSLWGAISGHANLVNHAAGWLEGGLTASFEKLIVDAEMLQMMAEYMRPIEVNDDTLALQAIEDVGPGGHFFGAEHTLQRYETAFYSPLVSDWQNFERWKEAGQQDTATRANRIWKQLLAEYQQPPLDPAIDDQLQDYVDRRKNGEPVE
ncbi:MAG: trimethylamine methyltransferase family protein [Gammaproteobacteria bacterium]|nr:trimethylamine methyltransferase family protein [Gammaproteobacteria bacterium]